MIESNAGIGNNERDGSGLMSGLQARLFQRLFLGRLQRLVALRRRLPQGTNSETTKLVNLALYSTYRDCVSLGLKDQAHLLLVPSHEARLP